MGETPDNIMNRRMSEAHVEMRKVEEMYMYLIEEAGSKITDKDGEKPHSKSEAEILQGRLIETSMKKLKEICIAGSAE